MADVTVVSRPSTEGKRLALVLTEDRVGHYPEFRDYFARVFDLDRIGLVEPGYVRSPSGRIYAFVFIGRSGEPFPSGLEVYIVVDALEPIDEIAVDNDLWTILEWMITGVGDPWTVSDLQETGRLYRVPSDQGVTLDEYRSQYRAEPKVRILLPPALSQRTKKSRGAQRKGGATLRGPVLPTVIDASRGVAAAGIPEIRLWASGPDLLRGTKATGLISS